MNRTILVILSNRYNRTQKPRFLQLLTDEQGNILEQKALRAEPRKPDFDEVWENDEGRNDFDACYRFSRKYGHKLQKKKK